MWVCGVYISLLKVREISTVAACIEIGGTLTHASVHFLCDMKATKLKKKVTQSNSKRIHYKFELDHNDVEARKNICFAKSKGAFDNNIAARWLKKFRSGYKNLDDR